MLKLYTQRSNIPPVYTYKDQTYCKVIHTKIKHTPKLYKDQTYPKFIHRKIKHIPQFDTQNSNIPPIPPPPYKAQMTCNGEQGRHRCGDINVDIAACLRGFVPNAEWLVQAAIEARLPANGDAVVGGVHKLEVVRWIRLTWKPTHQVYLVITHWPPPPPKKTHTHNTPDKTTTKRENLNGKKLILKGSSVRSIWTYLTASPCYATNTNKHGNTTNKYYKHD